MVRGGERIAVVRAAERIAVVIGTGARTAVNLSGLPVPSALSGRSR